MHLLFSDERDLLSAGCSTDEWVRFQSYEKNDSSLGWLKFTLFN